MTISGPFFVTIKYVYVGYDIESVSTYQLYVAHEGRCELATRSQT